MKKARNVIAALVRDESGAAAPEYGLLIALISVLLIAGALLLGTELLNLLTALANFFETAQAGP